MRQLLQIRTQLVGASWVIRNSVMSIFLQCLQALDRVRAGLVIFKINEIGLILIRAHRKFHITDHQTDFMP